MPSVVDIAEALADALTDLSPDLPLVIAPRMLFAPPPPAIDIYPATPAESNLAFGPGSRTHWWTVRLRTATSDADGVQEFLLSARDATGPQSVREAIVNATMPGGALDGIADAVMVDENSPTGFQLYEDASGSAGAVRYLGEEWRVAVFVSDEDAT